MDRYGEEREIAQEREAERRADRRREDPIDWPDGQDWNYPIGWPSA